MAGPEDSELAHKPSGEAKCLLEDVKKNMRDWGIPDELLVYHPGWFEDTVRPGLVGRLPYADVQQIAVLRLDGDLYRSTKRFSKRRIRRRSISGNPMNLQKLAEHTIDVDLLPVAGLSDCSASTGETR